MTDRSSHAGERLVANVSDGGQDCRRHNNNNRLDTRAIQTWIDDIDSVRAIIWRAELPEFRTTFASKQAEEILGYLVEQWTNDPTWWIQRIHPDDRDWVLRFSSREVERRRNHTFDYRMIAADGRVVWLRNIVNGIVDASDAREVVGVSVDITERKESERLKETFA